MKGQSELDRLELGDRVAASFAKPPPPPLRVERYTCGCEPGSLKFCHLHSPEPADLNTFLQGGVR